jgi:hypothetical protein
MLVRPPLVLLAVGAIFVASSAFGETPIGSDALPGIHRLGFAKGPNKSRLSAAATVGYGFTEAQSDADAAHHRQIGEFALGVAPVRWFAADLRLEERYDLHPDDGRGTDDGWVFDPKFGLRAPIALSSSVGIAPDVTVWLPGASSVGTAFEAATFDFRALATLSTRTADIGLAVGYRLDRSSAAGENAARLRPGDRLALGLSDFDAVLCSLGTSVDLGKVSLKGEVGADLLIGSGAPSVGESPIRALIGAGFDLTRGLALDVLVEGSLSSRPDFGATDPLIPIEPRVSALIGVRYGLEPSPPPPPQARPKEKPKAVAPKPEPPKAPVKVPVQVRLQDDDEQPVVGARVTIRIGDKTCELEGDDEGMYRASECPTGKGKLHSTGGGIADLERDVELSGTQTVELEAKGQIAALSAQIRGLVRSFAGKPVAATITVLPAGTKVTADAQGVFTIDAEPGKYEVVIEAEGYVTQKRAVELKQQGVVVLNADLVKEAP